MITTRRIAWRPDGPGGHPHRHGHRSDGAVTSSGARPERLDLVEVRLVRVVAGRGGRGSRTGCRRHEPVELVERVRTVLESVAAATGFPAGSLLGTALPRGARSDGHETATERLSRLLTMVPWLMNRQGVDIAEAAHDSGQPGTDRR